MRRPFVQFVILIALSLTLLGGCTSRFHTKKNLGVLLPGNTRESIIYELGDPATTTTLSDGTRADVFSFVQGTRASKKPPRPVESNQAEAASAIALMEHFGKRPLAMLTGKKITLQVNYDAEQRLRDVVLLRLE